MVTMTIIRRGKRAEVMPPRLTTGEKFAGKPRNRRDVNGTEQLGARHGATRCEVSTLVLLCNSLVWLEIPMHARETPAWRLLLIIVADAGWISVSGAYEGEASSGFSWPDCTSRSRGPDSIHMHMLQDSKTLYGRAEVYRLPPTRHPFPRASSESPTKFHRNITCCVL